MVPESKSPCPPHLLGQPTSSHLITVSHRRCEITGCSGTELFKLLYYRAANKQLNWSGDPQGLNMTTALVQYLHTMLCKLRHGSKKKSSCIITRETVFGSVFAYNAM